MDEVVTVMGATVCVVALVDRTARVGAVGVGSGVATGVSVAAGDVPSAGVGSGVVVAASVGSGVVVAASVGAEDPVAVGVGVGVASAAIAGAAPTTTSAAITAPATEVSAVRVLERRRSIERRFSARVAPLLICMSPPVAQAYRTAPSCAPRVWDAGPFRDHPAAPSHGAFGWRRGSASR
ncbi:hypothetical protein GCM10009643_10210 [Microbacterium aurantiacum]